jgi:PKHD-type hydroxylase
MQIIIANVLSRAELKIVRGALERARFIDGRATAGFAARLVKNNEQVDAADRSIEVIRKLVTERISKNELFKLAVRPKALSPVMFARYERGKNYGSHVDDPLMNGMRTDVSFTLFLSDPKTYSGGELVIESSAGEDPVKPPAGAMIIYPTTALHRVAKVTKGQRLVCVGWARSLIRDAARRELLFDLDTARRRMFARGGKSADYDLVSKSLANLMRMWVED